MRRTKAYIAIGAVIALIAIFSVLSPALVAQEVRNPYPVRGYVTDATGSLVPAGVTVTITDNTCDVSLTATTDATGFYYCEIYQAIPASGDGDSFTCSSSYADETGSCSFTLDITKSSQRCDIRLLIALPQTIVVSPPTATLNIGDMQPFEAVAKDASGSNISGVSFAWSSSNPAVGTIDDGGLFTAKAGGSTTVKATAEGIDGTAEVTVLANGSITGKVTDSATGLSIEGATVTAGGMTTQTNRVGSYTISLNAGTYAVSASKPGYVGPASVTDVVVEAGCPTTADFELVRNYVELELNDTSPKRGNVNQNVTFNLTVKNYGQASTYTIANLSITNATVYIIPPTTGEMAVGASDILVKIKASYVGAYPVTITATNATKSASTIIVANVINPTTSTRIGIVNVGTDSTLEDGTVVIDSNVTGVSVIGNGTIVEDSDVSNTNTSGDTTIIGSDVTNTTVTDSFVSEGSTTTSTTVTGSDLTNVDATGCEIKDVSLENIKLENATVTNVDGRATIEGDGAKVNTSGAGGVEVHFEDVYEDIAVEDLIEDQTDPQLVIANKTTTTDPAEAAKVGASLSLNSTKGGDVTISRCGINPGGSAFGITGFGGNIEGSYIHISHPDIPDESIINVTLELFYHTTDEPSADKRITWYNGTAGWEVLETDPVERSDGWYLSVTIDHLSTFAIATVSAPPGNGGSDTSSGTYPPGWGTTTTATPVVTATAVSTATPGVTPPELAPTPPTEPAAEEEAIPEGAEETPTKKKGIPGFTAVFAIAGLLAVAYAMMRRREDK